ncbi:MAG: hypothetical protein HQL78_09990 [Magnetococcales bacterium]|nr:hypothetical protein [Magnetococcales bacterium]
MVLISKEVNGLRKDGSLIYIMITVNSVCLRNNQTAFIVIAKDITEERKLQNELIQFEKMAALGGMVAGVSHEINTPIGIAVTGSTAMEQTIAEFQKTWINDGITEEELGNFFNSITSLSRMIRRNATRAAELVRSFKNIAVDQCNEVKRTFNVREYLQMVVFSMNHYLKKTNIETQILCPEDLSIKNFPGVFSQIVTNLISNSLIHGFTPESVGTIKISARLRSKNRSLILTYKDNGKGMPPTVREKVFEPFFTTNRGEGGSGLGMHVVYNLVTNTLNGQITCESSVGNGVLFTIVVPMNTEGDLE